MPVPNSGPLGLYKVIFTEFTQHAQGNNSLHSASIEAGFSTPDAMGDFYGYTDAVAPTMFSQNASSVTDSSMIAHGGVSSDGGAATKITGQNTTDNYIEISTTLNADLAPGTTLVIVPDTSYSGINSELRKNREYCVIPLNTAPPFASTDDGLATTSTYPNLMVSDLEFETLEVHLNASDVVDLETITWAGDGTPNKNIDIQGPNESGGTSTYKILINSDSYTT